MNVYNDYVCIEVILWNKRPVECVNRAVLTALDIAEYNLRARLI